MFIIASILCPCSPAEAAPKDVSHACCDDGENGQAAHGDDANCVHCGETTLADSQTVKVPTPVLSPAEWLPTAILLANVVAVNDRPLRNAPPPPHLSYQPSVLRQTCILRI